MRPRVSFILPPQIPDIWVRIQDWVIKVCEASQGRASEEETLDRLISGRAGLWLAYDEETLEPMGYAVTTIVVYPKIKMLTVEQTGGGSFHEWESDLHDSFMTYARANGCDGMELFGRHGWKRQLKKFGWSCPFVTCQLMFDGKKDDE